ncbi:MAG: hypothetical protein ACJ8CR_03490 [Roseiflexaceae bacterium]
MFIRTSLHRWAPALLCALLIGCGAPAATAPTAAPTTDIRRPTTDVPTTVAPTAAPAVIPPTEAPPAMPTEALPAVPTAEPTAVGLLPAPLYFIDAKNQIARIEVDGKTITQVTNEADKVFEFVVSPADGSLAYITIASDGFTNRLIRSDSLGQGRVELQTGVMRGLTIAYTGESIEVGVLDPAPGMQMTPEARTPGVWSFPTGRGTPAQIQAATPPTQGADGNLKPGDHYMPIAWSPDGQRLLLRTSINIGPDGPGGDVGTIGLALFEKPSGEVRQLLPTSSEPLCLSPSWDGQSVMVYCSTPYLLTDKTPALWRLNIVSGEQQTLIPIQDGEKTNSVVNVRELSDGLYSMVATSEANAPMASKYTLQRTALDAVSERKQLVAEPLALGYGSALWAEDGSGVVLPIAKTDVAIDLTWYPLRGGEPVVLQSGQLGAVVAWGR